MVIKNERGKIACLLSLNLKDSKTFQCFRTINKSMEQKKKLGHGGARPGAGRPKGSTDKVTIAGLLGAIETQDGRTYVELLAEDFVHARQNDKHLAQKYHNLILNKVAATLTQVETVEGADAVQAKAEAFAEALQDLVKSGKK